MINQIDKLSGYSPSFYVFSTVLVNMSKCKWHLFPKYVFTHLKEDSF